MTARKRAVFPIATLPPLSPPQTWSNAPSPATPTPGCHQDAAHPAPQTSANNKQSTISHGLNNKPWLTLYSHRHEYESECPDTSSSKHLSLHAFQWRPFTWTSSVRVVSCASHVFIQPAPSKLTAHSISSIYTSYNAYIMTPELMSLLNGSLIRVCVISKIINNMVEYCCFIRETFLWFDFTRLSIG